MPQDLSAAQELIKTLIEFCVNYSFQVLGAFLVLFLGLLLANKIASGLIKLFQKKQLDITLSKFMAGCVKVLILVFAVIIALGKFGITIAPFVAALSAMAFGVSIAVQGPLSNYGAGITIILTRPFVVGNTISVAGVSGVVEEVKLACTILTDEDGVRITIPNKDVVGQILCNSREYKIVEGVIGIGYDSPSEKAIQTLAQTLQGFAEVAREPKPQIGIQGFGDSSVNIGYRYWVPTARYFQTLYAVNLALYKALTNAGISIPFPQREIRILGAAQTLQAVPAGASK